jgi:hypothetical protein
MFLMAGQYVNMENAFFQRDIGKMDSRLRGNDEAKFSSSLEESFPILKKDHAHFFLLLDPYPFHFFFQAQVS